MSVIDLGAVYNPTEPPVPPVFTTNISHGQTVAVPYSWTASTSPSPESIEFYADGTLLSTDDASPFTHTLNLSAGSHVLGLCAFVNGVKYCMPAAPGETGFARINVPSGGSGTLIRNFDRVNSSCFTVMRNKYQPPGSIWSPPETTSGTPWPGGVVGQTDISTPFGNGIKFVCLDAMSTPWASTNRISNGRWESGLPNFVGTQQRWSGQLYFPSSGNTGGFPGGFFEGHVLAEIATTSGGTFGSTNGHKLFLTPSRQLRFAIRATNEQFASTFFTSSSVALDTWHSVVWEIFHTTSSSGYQKGWINGTQIMNYTGPTIFTGETVSGCGLGYYTTKEGISNEIWYGAWKLEQI